MVEFVVPKIFLLGFLVVWNLPRTKLAERSKGAKRTETRTQEEFQRRNYIAFSPLSLSQYGLLLRKATQQAVQFSFFTNSVLTFKERLRSTEIPLISVLITSLFIARKILKIYLYKNKSERQYIMLMDGC